VRLAGSMFAWSCPCRCTSALLFSVRHSCVAAASRFALVCEGVAAGLAVLHQPLPSSVHFGGPHVFRLVSLQVGFGYAGFTIHFAMPQARVRAPVAWCPSQSVVRVSACSFRRHRFLTMRSRGQRGEAIVFPDTQPCRCLLTRR
jgi:hypothetical protein